MIYYLDVDGVIANFNKPATAVIGAEYPPKKWHWYEDYPNGFERINEACTVDFWANLEWMPDGHDILREVWRKIQPQDEYYLLSTPMPNPGSWTGKALWVEKNIPEWKLIVTNAPKRLLASPESVLIDDKDENVCEFVKAGGNGIIVPRSWNSWRDKADKTVQIVKDQLESL